MYQNLLKINYYELYKYNIFHFIKTYNLPYYFLNLSEETFYNGIKNLKPSDYKAFKYTNPWLKKYSNNKIKLAEDILENGMYTPIFFHTINNKKYIIAGKHRLYSLLLKHQISPIHKKFLFIEIPLQTKVHFDFTYKKLILFNENKLITKIIPKNFKEIYFLIFDTGDALTPYLWKNNCTPFPPFNDEKLFEEWLNTPIEEPNIDGDIE